MTPEQEKMAYEELRQIDRARQDGTPGMAAQMADDLRLVLEIERTKAQERAAAATEKAAEAMNRLAGTATELLAGLHSLVGAIEAATSVAEAASDSDQLSLFEDGTCACGASHSTVD